MEELQAQLDAIAEQLADLALDRLRRAADEPDDRDRLVAEERRLTRARRAVEKASALLADRSDAD
ncbi:MAG: hypothetical protein ACRD12_01835 [Acidimicrobiales bacterium]